MNGIKLSLWIFFVLALITCTSAQDRENRQDVVFAKKSERLTLATGWYKSDGKWTDHANIISPSVNPDTSKTVNFYWLQSGAIDYKGKRYYVFFYEGLAGAYKYPNIKEDWEEYHEAHYLLLSKGEMDSLKHTISAKKGKPTKVTSKMESTPVFYTFTEPKLLTEVTNVLEGGGFLKGCFVVNSQNLKGQDIVRFLLPNECYTEYMEHEYFEVPADEFKKLLID